MYGAPVAGLTGTPVNFWDGEKMPRPIESTRQPSYPPRSARSLHSASTSCRQTRLVGAISVVPQIGDVIRRPAESCANADSGSWLTLVGFANVPFM